MLRVEKLTKSYNKNLFTDINFSLGDNEKVGLVGLNGSGKTTLFKLIAEIEEADNGMIYHEQSVGYLPQEFTLNQDQFVGEYLEELQTTLSIPKYKVDAMLGRLELNEQIDQYDYLYQLSDGQRMKLYLISLILQDENSIQNHIKPILLLDEPTNHLDIDGIMWFEDFLANYNGATMIISHDRDFLNNTVSKVFEIDEEKINIFEGNYDDYVIGKEEWIEQREKMYVMQEKRRKKLDKLLASARKLGDGKRRGKAVRAAKKRMDREVTKKEIDQYQEISVDGLNLSGNIHDKKKMLVLKDVEFSYDDEKLILHDVDLTIWGKQKVWLYGPNGSGKTTLIKLLIDQLTPQKGEVKWGENTTYAYFSQDQSHIKMDQKVGDYFVKETGVEYYKSFKVLEEFLFDETYHQMKISDLSPGQRARLSFAVFSQGDYDFLILDEPTNHLDIRTKEIIERALRDFQGNVLLISHDRYFVEQIEPDRGITIDSGKLIESV